jgi:hypothetical protein
MKHTKPSRITIRPNRYHGVYEAHKDAPWECEVEIPGETATGRFKTYADALDWARQFTFQEFTWEEVTSNGRFSCN